MVDVSKELNITLDDVDTKINAGDPEWKSQQKLQILEYLNPTDPTLIERDKYKKFVEEQIQSKEKLAEQGWDVSDDEADRSVPLSTSISKDLWRLCLSGLLVLGFITFLILSIWLIMKYCFRPKKLNLIDREAELAQIRSE